MQQLCAERVDGLHFQAARRFQRAREQSPRQGARRGTGIDVRAGADRVVERFVVERCPFAERVEHAFRHVGGCGLGECDAEDFFRLDAFEQQIDDALCQHMGLARTGVGSHPRRYVRIGYRLPLPDRQG